MLHLILPSIKIIQTSLKVFSFYKSVIIIFFFEQASEFSIRNPPSVCTDSELEQPEEDGPVDVCELLERVKLEGLAAQAIVKAMNDQTYSDDDSDPEPEVPEYK